jgi:membrane-bound lytic murein transglycosylase D
MAAAIIAKHPEAFGFSREEIQAESWTEYERVTIPHAVEVEALARAAEITSRELHELNPELRRSCTPPRAYAVKLPRDARAVFEKNWPSIAPTAGLGFARHTVVKGEGIAVIATAYGVPSATVLQMNGLKAGKRVKPGTELVIPLGALARRSGAPANEAVVRARNPKLVEAEPVRAARAAAPRSPSAPGQGTVQVQAGDSLWAISQRVGVKLQELCDWNGIKNPRKYKLQVGRELVVRPPSGPQGVRASVAG